MQTSGDPMLRARACRALMKKPLPFAPLKRVAIVTLVVTVLAGIVITDGVYTSYFVYVNWTRLQGRQTQPLTPASSFCLMIGSARSVQPKPMPR
jgi:hypothetical protein